jgi:hypothetical protein
MQGKEAVWHGRVFAGVGGRDRAAYFHRPRLRKAHGKAEDLLRLTFFDQQLKLADVRRPIWISPPRWLTCLCL